MTLILRRYDVRPLPLITLATTLAVAAGIALPTPVHAQDACATQAKKRRPSLFGAEGAGGLFTRIEGLARGDRKLGRDLKDTAQTGATQRMSEAGSVAACRAANPGEPAEAETASTDAPRRETATERARREQATADAKYPSRMAIPAEWKTAKDAYDAFGKVKCFGCEGGYAYAGWPSWPRDEFDGQYNGSETRLSRLPIGHVHRWSSNGFAGTLKVDGEEQVNGFRCRKMTYRLERDAKSAERPSLMCWGKANEYAGKDSWVGVF